MCAGTANSKPHTGLTMIWLRWDVIFTSEWRCDHARGVITRKGSYQWDIWWLPLVVEKHSLALLPGGQWYRSTLETWPWYHHYNDVIMGVSNHQPHHCLLNRSFRRRSKKTSKLRVTGLCAGNSPVTGELPAQRASNAENVSICWRHHESPWYPRKELAIGSYWYFRNHFSHRVFKDFYTNCLSYRYRNSHHQDRTRPFYIYDRISYTSQDGLYRLLKNKCHRGGHNCRYYVTAAHFKIGCPRFHPWVRYLQLSYNILGDRVPAEWI